MRPTARRRPRGTTPELSCDAAPDIDGDLTMQGAKLDRLQRRARRLGRQVQPGGDPILWSRWSRAVSECAELCERIAKLPVHDLAGLAIKYKALLWELVEDDLILDLAVRRRVIAFGRALEAVAKRSEL